MPSYMTRVYCRFCGAPAAWIMADDAGNGTRVICGWCAIDHHEVWRAIGRETRPIPDSAADAELANIRARDSRNVGNFLRRWKLPPNSLLDDTDDDDNDDVIDDNSS